MNPTIRTAQETGEASPATSSRFMRFMRGYTAAVCLAGMAYFACILLCGVWTLCVPLAFRLHDWPSIFLPGWGLILWLCALYWRTLIHGQTWGRKWLTVFLMIISLPLAVGPSLIGWDDSLNHETLKMLIAMFVLPLTAAFALTLTREQEAEIREDMSYEAGPPGLGGMRRYNILICLLAAGALCWLYPSSIEEYTARLLLNEDLTSLWRTWLTVAAGAFYFLWTAWRGVTQRWKWVGLAVLGLLFWEGWRRSSDLAWLTFFIAIFLLHLRSDGGTRPFDPQRTLKRSAVLLWSFLGVNVLFFTAFGELPFEKAGRRALVWAYRLRELTNDMVSAAERAYQVELPQNLRVLDDGEYERRRPYVTFYSSIVRSKGQKYLLIDMENLIFYLEKKTGLKIMYRRKDVIQETLEYMSKDAPIRDEAGDLFFIPVREAKRRGD